MRIAASFPLDSLEAHDDSTTLSLDVKKESETTYVLHVSPNPTLEAGAFRTEVLIAPRGAVPSGASGKPLPATRVIVRGYISRDVEPSPRSIDWGIVPIGRKLESRVVLRSLAGKAFVVHSVVSSNEDLEVRSEISDGRATLIISTETLDVGERAENVTAVVTNHDGEAIELVIPVSYVGFAGTQ